MRRVLRSLTLISMTGLVSSCASEQPEPAAAPPAAVADAEAEEVATVEGKASPRAIVVLAPSVPTAFQAPRTPAVMDQFGRAFIPEVLLVQQGQRVEFRNSENELHSVRVDRGDERIPMFNVATAPFQTYGHLFDEPGFYNVTCDVHQDMRALLLVTSTPHATIADEDGTFTLTDVAPGSYDLTMYVGGRRVERKVEIAGAGTVLVLDGS